MISSPTTIAASRRFLGWDQTVLPAAVRQMVSKYRHGATLDLSGVNVVVPGQRAGRRLLELLVSAANEEGLLLLPPEIVTEGRLAEMLYRPRRAFASELVQQVAWAQALREMPYDRLRHVVPHAPQADENLRWLDLADVIRRLHVELAADGLTFDAVRQSGSRHPGFAETERWAALAELQHRYLQILDDQELADIQTSRLKSIEFSEISTECDILLLGTVDLTATLRQMLEKVADRVTAYIAAPESMADHFDSLGCLISENWPQVEIHLDDARIHHVDGPVDQAAAVTGWLTDIGNRFRADEISIGVPDESLVPQLQREMEQHGVTARWVEGARIGATGPYRLLAVAVRFAGNFGYGDLAALVRHPDLDDWLCDKRAMPGSEKTGGTTTASLPAQLDCYYNAHLPSRVRADSLRPNDRDWPDLPSAVKRIEGWLQGIAVKVPLQQWGNLFREVLGAVYGENAFSIDDADQEFLHRTFRRILEECDKVGALPNALDTHHLSAAEAFKIVLGPLALENLPPSANSAAVEILGWLELPLDDAPALIITSFNDEFVPRAAGVDAFLPDSLRRELQLLHNESRYVRDAYAMCVLAHSRAELRVIVARRDSENNPLRPSRLLFACDECTMVNRANRMFRASPSIPTSRASLLSAGGPIVSQSKFTVPVPVPVRVPSGRISVSEFKSYLACPYRYYLNYVRKLEATDDGALELDGGAFGTLMHTVLSEFGRNTSIRHSDREKAIADYLVERLEWIAKTIYGTNQRYSALRLQFEQARRRLLAFAAKQVALVRDGWRIAFAENGDDKYLAVDFVVDECPINLIGRIDRIDIHETSRVVRIFDYKTADKQMQPDKAHRKGGDWIDLQLPLYRHLWHRAVSDLPVDSRVELGYFNLSKVINDTGFALADWDAKTLVEADDKARQVVRSIRENRFWPPVYPAPDYSEDLAAICLDNVRSQPILADDPGGGW